MLTNKALKGTVLDTIGVHGLDTQTHSTALTPEWLTKADNLVYTEGGKITFRKGVKQRTTATGNPIGSIVEHKLSGKVFVSYNGTIAEVNFSTGAFDNTFSTGASASNWEFVEFGDEIYCFQEDEDPVEYDEGSTPNWQLVSSATGYSAPSGVTQFDPSCGLGYYGRMWVGGVQEDKNVLYYSKIDDAHSWAQGDAGEVDLKSVWGGDEIVALHAYSGKLVIFGKQNIAIYNNPWEVATGGMTLDEVIQGVGCVSRDSIQAVGNDLYFVSDTGVRSLMRTATANQDKLPLKEISITVKDELISSISNSKNIKSAYVLNEGLYLVTFPDLNVTYVFDITHITPKQTPRITKWSFEGGREPVSMAYSEGYGLLFGQAGGHVCSYEGYHDIDYPLVDEDSYHNYTGGFSTVWMDLGGGYVSAILKKLLMVVSGGQGTDVGFRLYKDFELVASTSATFKVNPPLGGTPSHWNKTAKYGCNTTYDYGNVGYCSDGKLYNTSATCTAAGETWTTITDTSGIDQPANCGATYKYAPIFGLKELGVPLAGDAKNIRFEMDGVTNGYKTSIQSLSLLYKPGKIY